MAAQLIATKGFGFTIAPWVHGAGKQFFAGTALARDQHAGGAGRHHFDQAKDLLHAFGRPDQRAQHAPSRSLRRLASSSRSVPRSRDAFCRILRKRVVLTGFSMKSKAPLFMALTAASTLPWAVSRIHGNLLRLSDGGGQQFHAVHTGHAQVK